MISRSRPRIKVVGTGGSVAGVGPHRLDYILYPELGTHLTIEESMARIPEVKEIADVQAEDPYEGVLVAAPIRASKERVRSVVRDRADWIIRKTSTSDFRPRRHKFVSGESLSYLGRSTTIIVESTEKKRVSVKFDDWRFRVQVPDQLAREDRVTEIRSAFVEWYRGRAKQCLPTAVQCWTQRVGCSPTEVLIRGQRRIWGSCSADGTVRFNWRIIMAEPMLIDYVVVHELLHLRVRNHSHEYWDEFAQVMPEHLHRRQRLKEVGPYLTM